MEKPELSGSKNKISHFHCFFLFPLPLVNQQRSNWESCCLLELPFHMLLLLIFDLFICIYFSNFALGNRHIEMLKAAAGKRLTGVLEIT